MQQEEIWDIDTAQRYDTLGTGMFAPEVLGPTVDRLAELAGDGPVLEFAIGTGRVAVPLAERGLPVTGIELSPAMIDQLRTKADEATIPGRPSSTSWRSWPGSSWRLGMQTGLEPNSPPSRVPTSPSTASRRTTSYARRWKSHARIACAWAARNCRQLGPARRGAGSMPAVCRISHTVDAPIDTPAVPARPGSAYGPSSDSPAPSEGSATGVLGILNSFIARRPGASSLAGRRANPVLV
jgi:Methyltransferase domain